MIDVVIYRFTGNQGFLTIPRKWCEECDLLVEITKKTIAELGIENKVKLKVLPWWLWFWKPAITNFAWHAPILIVNGKLASQGIVLPKEKLIKVLTKMSVKRQTPAKINGKKKALKERSNFYVKTN